LKDTNFDECKLQRVDFSRAANLSQATLPANLSTCIFQGCNLQNAQWANKDLSQADLSGAVMNECNLDGASLAETKLTNARITKCSVANLQSLPPLQELMPLCRHYQEFKDVSQIKPSSVHDNSKDKLHIDLVNGRLAGGFAVSTNTKGENIEVELPRPIVFIKLVFQGASEGFGTVQIEQFEEKSAQWQAVSDPVETKGGQTIAEGTHTVNLRPTTSSRRWRIILVKQHEKYVMTFSRLNWHSVFE